MISLFGYTSCSLDKSTALGFAWENSESAHTKVLFHIEYNHHVYQYFLNAGAYDHEEEVLLADGARVEVTKVEQVKGQDDKVLYTLVGLKKG